VLLLIRAVFRLNISFIYWFQSSQIKQLMEQETGVLGLQDMVEGALEMECLSPWELCGGNLEGAPSQGPGGIFRKVSVDRHLYIGAPDLGNLEKGLSIRDFESRKGSGDRHLFL
jgi:hypothetical protein